ncbi:farnesyl pyrophosphate synthase-like [Hyperolius riggenbachi]|uniref:farnesyl pyrophosphate synthase-like n=1 Tax=Hyperolius riggenbachi TaxID=752182 RepID=UPI0035A390E7
MQVPLPLKCNQDIRMCSIEASSEHKEFCSFFETIVEDLTAENWDHPEIGEAMSWLKEVLEYNTPGGKCIRGVTVLTSYRKLAASELQKDDNIRRVLAVGWCIELLQAFFVISDDITDHAVIRRGRLPWYKKDGIGMSAVNDGCLLESCLYQILKKYCRGQPYYLDLLELFLEISYRTELGQALDLVTSQPGKVDLERFTETRFKAIAKFKTGFYTFYLPVAAAMYMAGIDDEQEHRNAENIFMEITTFYQAQDDYLDCFGDPSVMGKASTDIQENKCTWLVIEALKRVTPEQRRLLEENYGQDEAEKVQRVKQLYVELDLPTIYRQYEEESYQKLQTLISQHANGLSRDIYLGIAHVLYKRQK